MYFWLWMAVFIISLFIELATVNLVSIWFTVGSLFALMANQLKLDIAYQIVIFIILSIICILLIRPLAANYLRGNIVKTNADRAIGEHVTLLKPISENAWGEVKVNGVLWHARSYDNKPIEQGTKVEVLAIEGAKLVVKRI